MEVEPDEPDWEQIYARADKVIKAVIQAMPPPIQAEAAGITTVLDKWPAEGLEPDTLGIFQGFEPNCASEAGGPIFIYLGPLHEYCRENDLNFEEEVRITYLHELGHYLGLDEEDLDERGLG